MNIYFMCVFKNHTLLYEYSIPQMSGFVSLNARYTIFLARTRFDVLILLTLALSGELPTCILQRVHTPPVTRTIEVSHEACKTEF